MKSSDAFKSSLPFPPSMRLGVDGRRLGRSNKSDSLFDQSAAAALVGLPSTVLSSGRGPSFAAAGCDLTAMMASAPRMMAGSNGSSSKRFYELKTPH
jgi:hypothetical protein